MLHFSRPRSSVKLKAQSNMGTANSTPTTENKPIVIFDRVPNAKFPIVCTRLSFSRDIHSRLRCMRPALTRPASAYTLPFSIADRIHGAHSCSRATHIRPPVANENYETKTTQRINSVKSKLEILNCFRLTPRTLRRLLNVANAFDSTTLPVLGEPSSGASDSLESASTAVVAR
jgi:hypothetical protein